MDPSARRAEEERREEEERWERSRRYHRFHAGFSFLLGVAIAVLAWYVYPVIKRQDASLATFRDGIRARVQQLEDKAADRASLQQALHDEAAKVQKDLQGRIDAVSRRANQAAEQAYAKLATRLDAEVQSRTDGVANLKDRVATLESSRAEDQTEIAQLKQDLNQQLNQVRQQASDNAAQASQASQELAQVRRDLEDNRAGSSQQMEELRRDEDQNRSQVAAIADQLAVDKVSFEAGKNHDTELAGGISLYVTGTDVAYRRVNGWMWVPSEHRNLWLRGQSALEPVIFYGSKDGKKRELVFTNVAKNSVTGYLLLPKETMQASPAAAGGE